MATDNVIISRKNAQAAGLRHYFTGRPCKYGHIAKRISSTGRCLLCAREHSLVTARVERRNPIKRGKRNAAVRAWNARLKSDPKKLSRFNEQKRRWRRKFYAIAENQELRKAYGRKRYAEDPLRDINRVHKRRKSKEAAGGSFTPADIEQIYKMQRGRCAYCRVPLRRKYQIDHIDPHGSNDPKNLQLTCSVPLSAESPRCNQSKGSKDPLIWVREEFGFLL